MSKIEERELFFEHIKKIYMQNPNFKVTPDTIYNELKLFNVQDGAPRASNTDLAMFQELPLAQSRPTLTPLKE